MRPDNPRRVSLAGFGLRVGERFVYDYDFIDGWRHDIRIEQLVAPEPGRGYPVCTGGRRARPPEDCGGPWAFLEMRQRHSLPIVAARAADIGRRTGRGHGGRPTARCPHCGTPHRRKDSRDIVVRTLFGARRLPSPRWRHCSCRPQPTRTFSPLAAALPDRSTPELVYLQAKFGGLISYGLSARLLGELLPLGRTLHATTARRHTRLHPHHRRLASRARRCRVTSHGLLRSPRTSPGRTGQCRELSCRDLSPGPLSHVVRVEALPCALRCGLISSGTGRADRMRRAAAVRVVSAAGTPASWGIPAPLGATRFGA